MQAGPVVVVGRADGHGARGGGPLRAGAVEHLRRVVPIEGDDGEAARPAAAAAVRGEEAAGRRLPAERRHRLHSERQEHVAPRRSAIVGAQQVGAAPGVLGPEDGQRRVGLGESGRADEAVADRKLGRRLEGGAVDGGGELVPDARLAEDDEQAVTVGGDGHVTA
ncbi:MAG: hypothetical protein ACKVWR_14240 [Acidimicrobiales bacterium]